MTYRIRYRDKRRPLLGPCLLQLQADNERRAAGLARKQLEGRGIHPIILGVSPATFN